MARTELSPGLLAAWMRGIRRGGCVSGEARQEVEVQGGAGWKERTCRALHRLDLRGL